MKKKGHKFKDMTGHTYGSWSVIGFADMKDRGRARWSCVCICGEKRVVTGTSLRSGKSKSCGCMVNVKHGNLIGYRKNGYRRTINYKAWENMKCKVFYPTHSSHIYYRHVGIFSAWINSFAVFDRYMRRELGERPIGMWLGRIDKSVGFFPGNLEWQKPPLCNKGRRPWGSVVRNKS